MCTNISNHSMDIYDLHITLQASIHFPPHCFTLSFTKFNLFNRVFTLRFKCISRFKGLTSSNEMRVIE